MPTTTRKPVVQLRPGDRVMGLDSRWKPAVTLEVDDVDIRNETARVKAFAKWDDSPLDSVTVTWVTVTGRCPEDGSERVRRWRAGDKVDVVADG